MFIEATAPLIMVQIAIEKKIFMRDLPSLMMTTDFPTSVNWVRLLIALEGTETLVWCFLARSQANPWNQHVYRCWEEVD